MLIDVVAVGARTAPSSFDYAKGAFLSLRTVWTGLCYSASAIIFTGTYVWSAPQSSNLGLIAKAEYVELSRSSVCLTDGHIEIMSGLTSTKGLCTCLVHLWHLAFCRLWCILPAIMIGLSCPHQSRTQSRHLVLRSVRIHRRKNS